MLPRHGPRHGPSGWRRRYRPSPDRGAHGSAVATSPAAMLEAMPETPSPPVTRRARLWEWADERHVPLQTILVTVAVVVITVLAGKIVYKLREVLLLVVVAGFTALLLNPLVTLLHRIG